MDTEVVVGTAPGTALYLYIIPDFDTKDILDAYNRVVSDDRVDALSSGFWGCEAQQPAFAKLSDHIAEQAAAQGETWAAVTGDAGAFPCSPSRADVTTPASGPAFVAVGGTTLLTTIDGVYRSEWGLAADTYYGFVSSGGGVSSLFALPSYQKGVKHVLPSGRNVPDVSFDLNPGTGTSFFFQGAWEGPMGAPYDGDALSSDLFCALLTEVDQVKGERVGDFHGALYDLFRKYGYGSPHDPLFHDVTRYNNGLYRAVPGYDQMTGIGSIDGWNFSQLVK